MQLSDFVAYKSARHNKNYPLLDIENPEVITHPLFIETSEGKYIINSRIKKTAKPQGQNTGRKQPDLLKQSTSKPQKITSKGNRRQIGKQTGCLPKLRGKHFIIPAKTKNRSQRKRRLRQRSILHVKERQHNHVLIP